MEPVDTSKTKMKELGFPHSHIKRNFVLKACWANMPYACWGEHCMYMYAMCSVQTTKLISTCSNIAFLVMPLANAS